MMSHSLRSIVLAFLLYPAVVGAQGVAVLRIEPLRQETRCASERGAPDPVWQTLFETMDLDQEVAQRRLRVLEDSVTALSDRHPGDVELQFHVAAVLGARSEVEGGRTKMRVAQTLLGRLHELLAVAPEHGGSLHLLGRLHAAVMRMDWVTRFLATKVLGGAELSVASWNEAERLLEAAIASEPCIGDHRFQLARVYADRGRTSLAREQLMAVLDLGPAGARDPRVWRQALELLDHLGDD